MRNVRSVYVKMREVKFHHLVELYKKYSRKIPENCRYNRPYKISMENGKPIEIRLCLLHQPQLDLQQVIPHLVDVCQEPRHCVNCNGFVLRYGKEDIKALFQEELKDPKIKVVKYPDLCALEWVLEQPVADVPFYKGIQKIYQLIKKSLK